MKKIMGCRRTSLAFFAIICLTALGAYVGEDISGIAVAISGIVAAVAGANSWEASSKAKVQVQQDRDK